MVVFILVLVILALLGVLGAVLEGLLWLTFGALILLVAAAAFGYFKFSSWRSSS